MSIDIVSYELGKKEGLKTTVINADESTFAYDAGTKTGTVTMGGDGNG